MYFYCRADGERCIFQANRNGRHSGEHGESGQEQTEETAEETDGSSAEEANQSAESSNGSESGGQRKRFSELIWEEFLPKALLYGCPYDLFWHLNPTKLTAFRKAYEERLQQKEDAMGRNGLYTMRAINACFGGKYPEKPLFEVGESKESSERQEHDGYTEQEIKEAREALVMQLQIMEGQQRRAKRKKELFEH